MPASSPSAVKSYAVRQGTLADPAIRAARNCFMLAALLAVAGAAALAIDVPLARSVKAGACPGEVRKLAALCEAFGHGLGAAVIVLAVVVLDPARRRTAPRLLAASLGSGLMADVLKLLVARVRPAHWDLSRQSWESFAGWFPLLGNSSHEQSFPSAHTATAVGLAIALACYYPRGRWLFAALAAGAAAQRVIFANHFASDVLWGAAVGAVTSPLCVYIGPLARVFDRLEAWTGTWSIARRSESVASPR